MDIIVRVGPHDHVSGVTWDRSKRRWLVRITENGIRRRIGRYRDHARAVAALEAAREKQNGNSDS